MLPAGVLFRDIVYYNCLKFHKLWFQNAARLLLHMSLEVRSALHLPQTGQVANPQEPCNIDMSGISNKGVWALSELQ